MSTVLLLCFFGAVLAFQQPLSPFSTAAQPDQDFEVYRSDRSSDHSVRIKRQNATLCNTLVDQYTGWLDVGHHHLFFWYFAAASGDAAATIEDTLPLSLWLNGGPGSSSMLGMLGELGPCLINDHGNGTIHNPYGWNQDTALLFVDEPAGVGFSYLDEGAPPVTDSRVGMADMYMFLHMFVNEVMPRHAHGALHLLGESYVGHYLPALGTEILTQNRIHPHRAPLQLTSIVMGNAFVSPADTLYGWWETLCTTNPGVKEPVFNSTRCNIIARNMPHCMNVWNVCIQYPDPAICRGILDACGMIESQFLSESFIIGGRNFYDISKKCEAPPYCYAEPPLIEQYLNQPSTFKALGVPSAVKNFSMSSDAVAAAFGTTTDIVINYLSDVEGLLTAGIDILIYQGNLDLVCNTAGAKRWTARLAWDGQSEFTAKILAPWTLEVNGEKVKVGEAKEVNIVGESGKTTRFAFVTIDAAGHMVPQDQPVVALDMLTRWFAGAAFD